MRSINIAMSVVVCAIPLCALATIYASPSPATLAVEVESGTAVSAKGDRAVAPFNVGFPGVAVELSDQPHSAITVRDGDGNLIYRVDPASRTTTVAKRSGRRGTHLMQPPATNPVVRLPLPEGCESAFSPYAAPDK